MAETDIERAVTRYAVRTYAVTHLKLNVQGNRGVPDHLYLGSGARLMFIEFKRPGEAPRKLQVYWHKLLRRLGFHVSVVDNEEAGRQVIDEVFS